jgi:hypothetical protein
LIVMTVPPLLFNRALRAQWEMPSRTPAAHERALGACNV